MALDFTSALYLGLRHPSWSLRPWAQFSLGVPAALAATESANAVAQKLAALQGCARGTLGPSTLHLVWDLFGLMAGMRVTIFADGGIYPISRWGIERAAAMGAAVHLFAHYDLDGLRARLQRVAIHDSLPLVVADGFCPTCGRPAPVSAYLDLVREFGGYLVLDDTQALGIFGHSPGPDAPYGRGGGGMLRWNRVKGPEVVTVSSLAKGFGVPVAVLCGGDGFISEFESNSDTRVHCSPPSIAAVHAADHALAVNRYVGDILRYRLAQLVEQFRERLIQTGVVIAGGVFPVQTLKPIPGLSAIALHNHLLRRRIHTLLRRNCSGEGALVSVLLTARHRPEDVERVAHAILEMVERRSGERS